MRTQEVEGCGFPCRLKVTVPAACDLIARIKAGYAADFFLAPKLDDDPYVNLLKTYPKHIRLVFVEGRPIYRDRGDMRILARGYDEVEVQGVQKALITTGDVAQAAHAAERYPEIERKLREALPRLAPLIED